MNSMHLYSHPIQLRHRSQIPCPNVVSLGGLPALGGVASERQNLGANHNEIEPLR